MNDLEKLFLSELKNIYDGEQQPVKALPDMAELAVSAELKECFQNHLEGTKSHVTRLEQVFRVLGQQAERKSCKGLEGTIDEAEILAQEFKGNSALDAALIVAAQKAEHYEITSYGSLCSWAEEIGNAQALALLSATLTEEKEANEKLTDLGEGAQNIEATRHDTEKKGEAASSFAKVVSSGP